jgi:4-carboxymuconolactone decarboxylase
METVKEPYMPLSRRHALIASGTALAGLGLSASAATSPQQQQAQTTTMNKTDRRYPKLKPEEMYYEQRVVAEAVQARRDGGLVGPFVPLSYAPGILDRQQMLGEYCRFHTGLPPKLREWTIMIAARHVNSPGVFTAHARLAHAGSASRDEARWGKGSGGVNKGAIDAVAAQRKPEKLKEDEAIVYEFCTEMHVTGGVSDALFERAEKYFGKAVILDLIAIYGHYATLGLVYNLSAEPVSSRPFPDQAG